jgi:hypothetical protein
VFVLVNGNLFQADTLAHPPETPPCPHYVHIPVKPSLSGGGLSATLENQTAFVLTIGDS